MNGIRTSMNGDRGQFLIWCDEIITEIYIINFQSVHWNCLLSNNLTVNRINWLIFALCMATNSIEPVWNALIPHFPPNLMQFWLHAATNNGLYASLSFRFIFIIRFCPMVVFIPRHVCYLNNCSPARRFVIFFIHGSSFHALYLSMKYITFFVLPEWSSDELHGKIFWFLYKFN